MDDINLSKKWEVIDSPSERENGALTEDCADAKVAFKLDNKGSIILWENLVKEEVKNIKDNVGYYPDGNHYYSVESFIDGKFGCLKNGNTFPKSESEKVVKQIEEYARELE